MLRRLSAEGLGAALLLAAVVGSGIMAERLAGGNEALALLANTGATGAMLFVLITAFGPVSGAHLNPVVTLAFLLRRQIAPGEAAGFVLAQTGGAVLGVLAAHAMFGEPIIQLSERLREGPGQSLSEFVAAFGLVGTILAVARVRPGAVAAAVALYISAAYWFTASTAFANPAVTLARGLTGSFSGIAAASIPAYVAAQLAGGLAATLVFGWMFAPLPTPAEEARA
jgi:glycerol uptake facilitator-like aquaporin